MKRPIPLLSGLTRDKLDHAAALVQAEWDTDDKDFDPATKAQLYTCYAYDWYQMDMEEEGARLLVKADKVCPGYFGTLVIQHTKENEGFALVVKNLTIEIAYLLLSRLGEMK